MNKIFCSSTHPVYSEGIDSVLFHSGSGVYWVPLASIVGWDGHQEAIISPYPGHPEGLRSISDHVHPGNGVLLMTGGSIELKDQRRGTASSTTVSFPNGADVPLSTLFSKLTSLVPAEMQAHQSPVYHDGLGRSAGTQSSKASSLLVMSTDLFGLVYPKRVSCTNVGGWSPSVPELLHTLSPWGLPSK